MDQLLFKYIQENFKDGVFLILFLYLFLVTIPKMKKEHKQDILEMKEEHKTDIARLERKYREEMEKIEKKSEQREFHLMNLLKLFSDKYDILSEKLDQVLQKLEK